MSVRVPAGSVFEIEIFEKEFIHSKTIRPPPKKKWVQANHNDHINGTGLKSQML